MSSTPICRCRVLYMGSAVPHITKDGLHGIQEPLRSLYPEEGVLGARGIDSWLSVWSNGLLLENVDEKQKRVTRFFPIEALHYCAAVRHVTIPGADGERVERFLPLDSPFARIPTANNPPLFACILRRTAGIKVLECHAFVAKKEMAANALVRCCFHAYADNMYAKRLENGDLAGGGSVYGGSGIMAQTGAMLNGGGGGDKAVIQLLNGRSTPATNGAGGAAANGINPIQKVEQWRAYVHNNKNGGADISDDDDDGDAILEHGEMVSIYDGDENHKVWAGGQSAAPAAVVSAGSPDHDQQSIYADFSSSTIRSVKSVTGGGNSSTLRTSRPRQIAAPASPPPPPPPAPSSTNGKNTNGTPTITANGTNKTRPRKLATNGAGPHHYPGHPPHLPPPPPPNQNGYQRRQPGMEFQPMWAPPPGRKMRPGAHPNGHHPHGHPNQPQIVPYGFPPPPPNMMAPLPPPPHLMGAFRPFPPGHPPPMMQQQHPPTPKSKKGGASAEEPVYLPSARPMSPVASYQPGAFPYEQYYLNQHHGPPPPPGSHYAHPNNPHYTRPSSSNNGGSPGSGPPTPQPPANSTLPSSGKNTKYKKKKSDKPGSSGESGGGGNGGGSKFNTGIYRKKGHLNERAFSYSIRQEHRSRSHSSLATLNFNGPSNGIEVIGNGIEDEAPPMINGHGHHAHHYNGATNGGHENHSHHHQQQSQQHHNNSSKNVTTTTALVNAPPPSNGQQHNGHHQNGGNKMAAKVQQNGAPTTNGKNLQQSRAPPAGKVATNGSAGVNNKTGQPNGTAMNGKRNNNGSGNGAGVHRMMNDLSLSDGEFEEQNARAEKRQPSMSRRKILAATNR